MPIRCVYRVSIGAFLPILLVCGGCGNHQWRPVSGTATFDGKPIVRGSISFEPADGKGSTAGAGIEDGEYQVARVMPGKKIVRIVAVRKTGKRVQPPISGPPGPSGGATIDEVEQYIPTTYNTQSTLTREVTAVGPNQIDFHLSTAKTEERRGSQ